MSDQDDQPRSPWARPGFLASAVVVALVAILLIVVVLRSGDDDSTDDQTSGTPTSTASTSASDSSASSVCGLGGHVRAGVLAEAPKTTWKYQDVTAYPASGTFGPGATTSAGIRYCFQHSPTGALFAAANAVVQSTDAAHHQEWLTQFLVDSPDKQSAVAAVATTSTAANSARLSVAGFRLLAYADTTASVDIAFRASANGQIVYGSVVYRLVWSNGDWKANARSESEMGTVAQLPDLAGYVSWTA